jgi:hypothetical protein
VLTVEDWAEIRRLHRAEGMPIKAIARHLAISRNTVRSALASDGPPKYQRRPAGSAVDAFEPRIRELLQAYPAMPATVIAERVGWDRGLTVLKDRVRELRPAYLPPDPGTGQQRAVEVAEAAVGVDHVPAGVTEHAGGFGRVDQVVRVALPVDLGQRPDLALAVVLVPGGPLVFVPVVRAADPSGLLRMPGPGPVPEPAVDRGAGDAAVLHIGATDHLAAVDRRNRTYPLEGLCARAVLAVSVRPGRPQVDLGIVARWRAP